MEVDNQSPPDCEARWVCNECQMQAPKVWPPFTSHLTWVPHRDTRTLWMRRLPLQLQSWRRLASHLRPVRSSWKPMARWLIANWANNFPPFSGAPPQPCPHAGHQVLLPEHLGPQRRVRQALEEEPDFSSISGAPCPRWRMSNCRQKRTWPGTSLRLPGKFSLASPGWRWDLGWDQSNHAVCPGNSFIRAVSEYPATCTAGVPWPRNLGRSWVRRCAQYAHNGGGTPTGACAHQTCDGHGNSLARTLLQIVMHSPQGMHWLPEVRASTPGRGEALRTGQVFKCQLAGLVASVYNLF